MKEKITISIKHGNRELIIHTQAASVSDIHFLAERLMKQIINYDDESLVVQLNELNKTLSQERIGSSVHSVDDEEAREAQIRLYSKMISGGAKFHGNETLDGKGL